MPNHRKLTAKQVMKLPDLVEKGMSWKDMAAYLGVGKTVIGRIFSGEGYKELQPAFQPRLAEARKVRDALRKKQPATWVCTKCKQCLPRTAEFFQPLSCRRIGFESYCLDCKSLQNRTRYIKKKLQVLHHYSGGKFCCQCCGVTNYEFLTIDHINGGGRAHRKRIKADSIYSWLIQNNYPEGFRVLCLSCNGSHGFFGYCPHKGRPKDSLIASLLKEYKETEMARP